jgi:hypothetical protein
MGRGGLWEGTTPFFSGTKLGVSRAHGAVHFIFTTYDRSVTSGTWLSIVTDQQMLEQRVSPSVPFAAQLSVFLKGNVSISSPNPFSFSKRRDGISLEPIVFFTHRRYCVPSNHKCTSPRGAATIRSYHACVSYSICSSIATSQRAL